MTNLDHAMPDKRKLLYPESTRWQRFLAFLAEWSLVWAICCGLLLYQVAVELNEAFWAKYVIYERTAK